MPKVISDHTENVKLYLILFHVHYEINMNQLECKQLVLDVLSFHMLSTWVKHQIVDTNIQGLS